MLFLKLMITLASHIQNLDAERQKYKAQVRRLCQENAWIRDELNSTQQLLIQSEQVNTICYIYKNNIFNFSLLQNQKKKINIQSL